MLIARVFLPVAALLGLSGVAVAQSGVRMPSEFEAAGTQLAPLFSYFGGVASHGAVIDPTTIYSGSSCRVTINFRPDALFNRAGAGLGTLGIAGPGLSVPPGADTFSITIQGPPQGTLTFKVTIREDDDGNGVLEADVGDDQWESAGVVINAGTNVYNLPVSGFTNVGSGNGVQNFSTVGAMAWFITFETSDSYPGGVIETPVSFLIDHAGLYAGAQSIPQNPGAAVFHERWTDTVFASVAAGGSLGGDEGAWRFSSSEAAARAEVIRQNASRAVRMTAGTGGDGVLAMEGTAVALNESTTISFSSWSTLVAPTISDRVALELEDANGNVLVYVVDRGTGATARSSSTMREVFLPIGAGRYERRLGEDFASIPSFVPAGATITGIRYRLVNEGGSGGGAVLDDVRISGDTLLGAAGPGGSTSSSADSAGRTTITYTSATGRPVMLQSAPGGGGWVAVALDEATGIPGAPSARATSTWVDAQDGRTYVGVTSTEGLFVVDTAASPMSVRNLAEELNGATITGPSTVFTSVDGFINIVGLADGARFVRYFQTGVAGQWGYMNITESDLAPHGIPTPAIVSNLVPYVSSWGGLHVAGLDAAGNIHAVWWAPGAPHWFANNLSAERGTPPLIPEAGVSAYVTPWGGLNLTGLDQSGNVVVLWWAPALGEGNWQTTDLTSAYGGPTLDDVGLASFVTPWGALNICGVTPGGDLVNYWWVPGFETWLVTSITGSSSTGGQPRLVGGLSGLGAPTGTISIIGASDNGDVVRYFWRPSDGAQWNHENVRESGVRR